MVSGDTLRDFTFQDPETEQKFTVNLSIKDGIHLKLLERIANSIKVLGNK